LQVAGIHGAEKVDELVTVSVAVLRGHRTNIPLHAQSNLEPFHRRLWGCCRQTYFLFMIEAGSDSM
jgi:hypothetical protein